MKVKQEAGISPLRMIFTALAFVIAAWCIGSIVLGIVQAEEEGLDIFRKYIEFFGLTQHHTTELGHYIYIKGVEYLLAGLFFIAFPVYYMIIHDKDTK